MDSEFSALKAHIDAIVPTLATKADIEILRAEMHKMSAEGFRWMVASMVAMFIGFGGLYFAASRSMDERTHPVPVQLQAPPQAPSASAAPAQTLQPIVIYLSPPK